MGIYSNGKINDFSTPSDLLKLNQLSFVDKIRFGLTSIYLGNYAKWKNYENVSALNWFEKWTGPRVVNMIWAPLLRVKFGKHYDKVPLAWMIGRLKQRMNSRKSGDEKLGYVNGSLKVLLDALIEKLETFNVELVTKSKVDKLVFSSNTITGVETGLKNYSADQVVMTIPSPYIVDLVKQQSPLLGEQLANIEYFGAICTIYEMNQKLSDIYWLNIAANDFPFGGIIEHTNFISPEKYGGKHIVYLSRYFTQDEEIAKMTNEEIILLMLKKLKQVYPEIEDSWIDKTHVFKTNTAATVCDLNFSNKITDVKTPIDQLYIANMAHIYPDERSVNNSIRVAADTCNVMGINSEFVTKGITLAGSIGFDDSTTNL